MKTITIGRDASNDICINDERISRRHALLRIYLTGKMEIVDMSANGTYVNGIRANRNAPFPVSRKDTVVFARARQLIWDEIPNTFRYVKITVLSILALIVVVSLAVFVVNHLPKFDPTDVDYEMNFEAGGGEAASAGEAPITKPQSEVPESGNNGGQTPVSPSTNDTEGKSSDSTKKGTPWYQKAMQRDKDAAKSQASSKDKNKKKPKEDSDSKKDTVSTQHVF